MIWQSKTQNLRTRPNNKLSNYWMLSTKEDIGIVEAVAQGHHPILAENPSISIFA